MSFHPYKCFRTFTVWKHFLKDAILCSQYRAAKLVTGELLSLYFGIGGYVSAHSRQEAWGTSVIDRISEQLRRELPGLRGFSSQNIRNMRTFYEYWMQYLICSPMASKLQIAVNKDVIDIDNFSLQKWSPMASEINREEFLGISFSHHMEILHKTKDLHEILLDSNEIRQLRDVCIFEVNGIEVYM